MVSPETNSPVPYDVCWTRSGAHQFLAIGRVDLLGQFRRYRFLITAQVSVRDYARSPTRMLESAIEAGHLHPIEIGSHAELVDIRAIDHHAGWRRIGGHCRRRRSFDARGHRRSCRTASRWPACRAKQYPDNNPFEARDDPGGIAHGPGSRRHQSDWATNHRFNLAHFQSFANMLPAPP